METLPFYISENALKEIKSIVEAKKIPDGYGLRVGIKGGGCSGISYLFGFDLKQANDEEFSLENIPVYIEKKHFMYIAGLQIDFEEGAQARGFTFENPNTNF